ncbi:MAG: C4-dicarboxylate transporter DctA [Methanobrevibacter sp.]|jgi:aerobic C4-dicarboxylate transport protein|nr:C4-dicarboxylate transporter DctA [Candidatus Methanovirga australis]
MIKLTFKIPNFFKNLYIQVIIGMILGILVGNFYPKIGVSLEPLSKGFINLIKMLITPIIFGTLVTGIVGLNDLKKAGKLGIKALIYFEIMSTIALIIGMVVGELVRPGNGLDFNLNELSSVPTSSNNINSVDFLLHIIPNTVFSGFVNGDILQVLLVSILFSVGLLKLKGSGNIVLNVIDKTTKVFYEIVRTVTYFAPIGAFGAMGFTIGSHGIEAISNLFTLVVSVYSTCIVFVLIGLGIVAKMCGFNIVKLIIYIKDEVLLVLATSSSEVALPNVMEKMERIGCEKSVVGFVVPTGYSFNLDGTSVYLTMATLFIFQAFNIDMSLQDKLLILFILMLTSKGAAAVTGGGFIVLSATLSTFNQIPIEALTLLLGVDRILSEVRAITNLIGNSVATIVIAKWENLLDKKKFNEELNKSIG